MLSKKFLDSSILIGDSEALISIISILGNASTSPVGSFLFCFSVENTVYYSLIFNNLRKCNDLTKVFNKSFTLKGFVT